MEERYPVRVDGRDAGVLTVSREGLWSVFSLRCADPGRLLRLSVYGDGAEGYLGVPEPEGGELRLVRRFSAAQTARLPGRIEYAGEAGLSPAGLTEKPVRGRETETLWYAVGDGTLYTRTPRGAWRAVPLTGGRLPPGAAEARRIEGADYALFPLPERE